MTFHLPTAQVESRRHLLPTGLFVDVEQPHQELPLFLPEQKQGTIPCYRLLQEEKCL